MDLHSAHNDNVRDDDYIFRDTDSSRSNQRRKDARSFLRILWIISSLRKFFQSGEVLITLLIFSQGLIVSINGNSVLFNSGWIVLSKWVNNSGVAYAALSYFLGFSALFVFITKEEALHLTLWALITMYWAFIWIAFLANGKVNVGDTFYAVLTLVSFGIFFFGILSRGLLDEGEEAD